jgi:UPF0755 protein
MSENPSNFAPEAQQNNLRKPSQLWKYRLLATVILFVLIGGVSIYQLLLNLNTPPNEFPGYLTVSIEEGTSVKTITKIFEEAGVVRSSTFLYYTLVFLHDPTDIKASTYLFEEPQSTLEVAKRLTMGDFDTDLVRITHIEGERASTFAERIGPNLPSFNVKVFIEKAEPQEGRLFPDTYLVPSTFTEEELLALLLDNFDKKIAKYEEMVAESPLSLDEVLILASIIEREANTFESMKLVSGVLQNRLQAGMPLQADASIEYVLDKPLAELTPEDLEIESPYNTYLYKGLPPTAIGNPGLEAIEAVLRPAQTEFFYYITDDNGDFHFAKNYNEHLRNIEKYLR